MATYEQIQEWVKVRYGIAVKTCWIAHVKVLCGLKVQSAPNRINKNKRQNPCPPDKREIIKRALRHFGMI